MFIAQIYHCEFSRLCNLHPWYWNTLFYSLISSENSAFAHTPAFIANHYNVVFLFHWVLITNGCEALWKKFTQHFYT